VELTGIPCPESTNDFTTIAWNLSRQRLQKINGAIVSRNVVVKDNNNYCNRLLRCKMNQPPKFLTLSFLGKTSYSSSSARTCSPTSSLGCQTPAKSSCKLLRQSNFPTLLLSSSSRLKCLLQAKRTTSLVSSRFHHRAQMEKIPCAMWAQLKTVLLRCLDSMPPRSKTNVNKL